MSISSLEKDHIHKSQPSIFSFGVSDSKSFFTVIPQGHSIRGKDSKLGYVLEMIEKYGLEQKVYEQQPSTTSNPLYDVDNTSITRRKASDSRFLSYLSTSYHLNSSYEDELDNQSITHQQQALSHFKLQLQETHQNILHKYITPIKLIDCDQDGVELQYQQEEDGVVVGVRQFSREARGNVGQEQLVDKGSVPLVESVIMPPLQATYKTSAKQQNEWVQSRVDKFEEKEQTNNTKVQHDSLTVEGELKISQLMAFCLIVLVLLFWKM